MARETVTLDPTSEDASNVQVLLDDKTNGIELMSHEYPVEENEAQWASSADTEGARRASTRPLNRKITAVARCFGTSTMATRVKELQQKIGKLDREGGTYKRTLADSTTIVFDVVAATIDVPSDWAFAHSSSVNVEMVFTCLPYGRGAPVTLNSQSETSLPALVFTTSGAGGTIAGDVPALGKLVVTEADADDQWWVRWGIQSRYYNSGTTHLLRYEAETLLPLGGAAVAARSGASGGTVVQQGTLTPTYQAMLSTAYAAGTVHQQHIGDFAVMARLYRPTSNAGTVTVALEWGEGDFRRRTVNTPVVYDLDEREGDFTLADLGQVRLSQVAQGNQRWEGRVIAKSTATGDDLEVDCLMLFPIAEGSGIVKGVQQFENVTSFVARDEFDQTAGNLATKTLPVGGTWTGAGDADDFTLDTANHYAQRTALSDADALTGRYAIAGTTSFTATLAQVDVAASSTNANVSMGLLARYTDTSNYLTAVVGTGAGPGGQTYVSITVWKRVAGTATTLFASGVVIPFTASTFYTVRLVVGSAGRYFVWFGLRDSPMSLMGSGYDSTLATGGTLASGKVGLYDVQTGATAITRRFDNFFAATPTLDAAMFASQSLEIRHDRVIREDSSGSYWTTPSSYEGDYLLIPPAGRENRTTRIIVKASRQDPDTMFDPAIDDITGQLVVTPRYYVVPES